MNFEEKRVEWHGISILFTQNDTVIVPPRARAVFPIKITNPHLSEGFVLRIQLDDDTYLGNEIVKNREGIAYIGIINTRNEKRSITVPTLEIQELERISTNPSFAHENSSKFGQMHVARNKREGIASLMIYGARAPSNK